MLIYKITNKQTGQIYIGQTIKNITKYWGSGVYIKNAIKKYGQDAFTREILCYCSSQNELNEKETFYINEFNCIRPNGYNIRGGGAGGKLSDKHKEKISIANKGKKKPKLTKEHKQKLSIVATGRKHTDETRQKLSIASKNRKRQKLTEEHKQKLSIVHKGKQFTEEHKQKISTAKRGRNLTKEHKQKISVAQKNRMLLRKII